MSARSWFYGSRGFGSPSPMFDSVELIPATKQAGGDIVSLELAGEDPVCECIYISEDIVDASFCRVHGKAPAPAIEPEFSTADEDADIAF